MRAIRSFLVTIFLFVTFSTTSSEPLDQVIRGYPCVKKMNHLECVQPGPSYPRQNIETYIEENRATIRRMFGEISQPEALPISSHQEILNDSSSYNKANRIARSNHLNLNQDNKIDSCESLVEIITPYWAANSGGKIRAIVNTQHLQQAIQQEMCRKTQTKRCNNDCGCEQKYKWHRLLAYDPDDNCKGIFMDWFLFPSCCVCRCSNIFTEDQKN